MQRRKGVREEDRGIGDLNARGLRGGNRRWGEGWGIRIRIEEKQRKGMMRRRNREMKIRAEFQRE